MSDMRYFIDRATACSQTISYSCWNSKVSGFARPCEKNKNQWIVPCDGDSCACDTATKDEMKHDKQRFEDKDKLPLGRIIINKLATMNSSLMYTVGPVECFQGKRYFPTFF